MQARASVRTVQLKLFHPALSSPRWEDLPCEIRQQTVRLLAQLLRAHCMRSRLGEAAKQEACDD